MLFRLPPIVNGEKTKCTEKHRIGGLGLERKRGTAKEKREERKRRNKCRRERRKEGKDKTGARERMC